ncbi:MAG: hypothetical protein CM15mP74_25890 [Halieaceae bacterium]|nr:MAG: hypothetical protein CM15mP74_25890 [Halieaceae bacterium]
MEASSSFLMTLGAASLLISWILLLITSWQEEYAWGMVSLYCLRSDTDMPFSDSTRRALLWAVRFWVGY